MKKLMWITTFSLLSLFTIATLFNTFSAPAYAASLDKERVVHHRYLECDRDDHFVRTSMLCALSDQQFALLASKYHLSTDVITVHGTKVALVRVTQKHLSKKSLESLLGDIHSLTGGKCIVVKRAHSFFFLLAPQIS